MKLSLDKYANLQSPIHDWHSSYKLVALLCLIFAFSLVEKLTLLPAMIVVTASLYCLSRLPLSFWLNRLRYPGLFILGVVSLLPFAAGETILFRIGAISVKQEGCLAVVLIVTRFICILTVSLVLFGTAPFLTSMKAMRSLGLPAVMIDMMLLTYRYLEQLSQSLRKMQQAMRLRGFHFHSFNRRTFSTLANLAGSLLVRSYEQSERVYRAMLLRGYSHRFRQRNPVWFSGQKVDSLSKIASIVTILLAVGFLTAQFWWL